MTKKRSAKPLLSIGAIASRTGLAITAIRFYESEKLITPSRNAAGQRQYRRDEIRRLSFIKISQNLGFSLKEIHDALNTLPNGRTPTKKDWEKLSKHFAHEIDQRIAKLTQLRENLTGCIGCGCLSLQTCRLYNPDDDASNFGSGPRYLLGNQAEDIK